MKTKPIYEVDEYPPEIKSYIDKVLGERKPIIIGHVPCPMCRSPAAFNQHTGKCRACGYQTIPLWKIYRKETPKNVN